jgi:hypothetical protein
VPRILNHWRSTTARVLWSRVGLGAGDGAAAPARVRRPCVTRAGETPSAASAGVQKAQPGVAQDASGDAIRRRFLVRCGERATLAASESGFAGLLTHALPSAACG